MTYLQGQTQTAWLLFSLLNRQTSFVSAVLSLKFNFPEE